MAIVVFEHSATTGALRLGATLRDYGHKLRVVGLNDDGAIPMDLDDVDGVITTGGPQAANDDRPWAEPEMKFLQAAHEAELPIVGICLGNQVLAKALGGEVGPIKGGIELGWHEVSLTDAGRDDIIHAGLAWESMQFHWHREQVTKPPPGARVLAKSKRCNVQAWALGLRTYAFQYHPEVYPETIDIWAEDEPEALEEAGLLLDKLNEQTREHYPAFERLTARLFESIALLLMPADRRITGLVKDLHH